MGGRGGSSGVYAGRFSSGTNEQLQIAEHNLNISIERERVAIKNSPTEIVRGWEDHKAQHEVTLKALKQQMSELQKEKKKRGL